MVESVTTVKSDRDVYDPCSRKKLCFVIGECSLQIRGKYTFLVIIQGCKLGSRKKSEIKHKTFSSNLN